VIFQANGGFAKSTSNFNSFKSSAFCLSFSKSQYVLIKSNCLNVSFISDFPQLVVSSEFSLKI
jgi:hypothetical protein